MRIEKANETSVSVDGVIPIEIKNPIAGTDYYVYDRPKKGLKISKKRNVIRKILLVGFIMGLFHMTLWLETISFKMKQK